MLWADLQAPGVDGHLLPPQGRSLLSAAPQWPQGGVLPHLQKGLGGGRDSTDTPFPSPTSLSSVRHSPHSLH